jgi:hypothetical protein
MTIADLTPGQAFRLKRTNDKYRYIDDGEKKSKHRVIKTKTGKKQTLHNQCEVIPCE